MTYQVIISMGRTIQPQISSSNHFEDRKKVANTSGKKLYKEKKLVMLTSNAGLKVVNDFMLSSKIKVKIN